MITLTSISVLNRVKQLLPKGWFSYTAANRDAIVGSLGDRALWAYNFVLYAYSQCRLATATGIWLDIISYDFLANNLLRGKSPDVLFRAQIQATILQERVTRAGMISAVTTVTGKVPSVFEPWNTYDTGAYSAPGKLFGQMGYGVGRGGYGSMILTDQVFMLVTRSTFSGVANVSGYGNYAAGYEVPGIRKLNVGASEYLGPNIDLIGVTNGVIYQTIVNAKPTGVTVWTAIGGNPNPKTRRPCIFHNNPANSQNIAII